MPGLYLGAIVVSMLGIGVLDRRFGLALFVRPGQTLAAVGLGVVFFIVWDIVGIATGVFFQGDSDLYTGIALGPEFPLEELFFLTFLCYLALVLFAAATRWRDHRNDREGERR